MEPSAKKPKARDAYETPLDRLVQVLGMASSLLSPTGAKSDVENPLAQLATIFATLQASDSKELATRLADLLTYQSQVKTLEEAAKRAYSILESRNAATSPAHSEASSHEEVAAHALTGLRQQASPTGNDTPVVKQELHTFETFSWADAGNHVSTPRSQSPLHAPSFRPSIPIRPSPTKSDAPKKPIPRRSLTPLSATSDALSYHSSPMPTQVDTSLPTSSPMIITPISSVPFHGNAQASPVKHKRIASSNPPTCKIPPKKTYESGKQTKKAPPRRWTCDEDNALRRAVANHREKNWKAIASRVPGRNHTQCLQRWTKVLAPGLVKGHWSPHEDALLCDLVTSESKNWGEVAALIPGRTSKQCRERWHNHLDPNIVRGAYTPEEDRIIVEAQARLGNRWSVIAAMLPGRTEDAVKIRWKSHCRVWSRKRSAASMLEEEQSPTEEVATPSTSDLTNLTQRKKESRASKERKAFSWKDASEVST